MVNGRRSKRPPVVVRGGGGTVLDGLRSLALERGRLDDLLIERVQRARRDGHTWTEIGAALGVSAQAVQQRYGARP